jgi:protein-tyrosine phosphatase
MKPTIYWIDGPWPGKMAIVARPRGNEWLEDEIEGIVQSDIDVIISLLTSAENLELGLSSEADVVQQKGAIFKSFPITDYGVPESLNSVHALVSDLEGLLEEGKSVAIHCRQGIGSIILNRCVRLEYFNGR